MSKVKLPKWFEGGLYKEGAEVTNRFSGESCYLNAEELSMYDFIMGTYQFMELGLCPPKKVNDMRKGLTWFTKKNPEAYYVLLDYLDVTDMSDGADKKSNSFKNKSENIKIVYGEPTLDLKNFKTDILSFLQKEKIKSFYFNFFWVEPNREFELVEGCYSIDDFDLFVETYNKISNESLENWQIMTLTKQEKLLDILCEIDHPYDNTQQDCNCTLELKNDRLTYKIEEDWDNGYFNHETGEWEEGNEDDALVSFWEIKDDGIFNMLKE